MIIKICFIQVINWDINNNKIESITKDLIVDSRKRVQEIISGQKKDMTVLKVCFKRSVLDNQFFVIQMNDND